MPAGLELFVEPAYLRPAGLELFVEPAYLRPAGLGAAHRAYRRRTAWR